MASFVQNCSFNWSSVFCSLFFCSVVVQRFVDARLFCLLMCIVVEDFHRTYCYL